MHEEPPVFNYRVRGRGPAVKPGLVVAIEPMVTAGGIETVTHDDDWTVSDDGRLVWPRTGSTRSRCTPTASGC